MKNKKLVSVLLAGTMMVPGAMVLTACGKKDTASTDSGTSNSSTQTATLTNKQKVQKAMKAYNEVIDEYVQTLTSSSVSASSLGHQNNTLSHALAASNSSLNEEILNKFSGLFNGSLGVFYTADYLFRNAVVTGQYDGGLELGKTYKGTMLMGEDYPLYTAVDFENNITYVHFFVGNDDIYSEAVLAIDYDYAQDDIKALKAFSCGKNSGVYTYKILQTDYKNHTGYSVDINSNMVYSGMYEDFVNGSFNYSKLLSKNSAKNTTNMATITQFNLPNEISDLVLTEKTISDGTSEETQELFNSFVQFFNYKHGFNLINKTHATYTEGLSDAYIYSHNHATLEVVETPAGNYQYASKWIPYDRALALVDQFISSATDNEYKAVLQSYKQKLVAVTEYGYTGTWDPEAYGATPNTVNQIFPYWYDNKIEVQFTTHDTVYTVNYTVDTLGHCTQGDITFVSRFFNDEDLKNILGAVQAFIHTKDSSKEQAITDMYNNFEEANNANTSSNSPYLGYEYNDYTLVVRYENSSDENNDKILLECTHSGSSYFSYAVKLNGAIFVDAE